MCKGQHDKEEAQNIEDLKCHDINECWRKANKDQKGAWTVARLVVISRSRPQLDLNALASMKLVYYHGLYLRQMEQSSWLMTKRKYSTILSS